MEYYISKRKRFLLFMLYYIFGYAKEYILTRERKIKVDQLCKNSALFVTILQVYISKYNKSQMVLTLCNDRKIIKWIQI